MVLNKSCLSLVLNADMFPKGTKRKFSDSADDPAPEPATPPAPPPRPLAPPPPRPLASTYSLQRQSLLDMSLIKLQLCHMLVEPNLCRSVLIANTVRQIQEEMTQDGSWQLMTQALAAAQCPADRLVASELLCRPTDPAAAAAAAAGGGPKPYALVGEAYRTEEVVMEGPAGEGAAYLAGPFGVSPCWQEEEEEEEEDGDCEEEEEEEEEEEDSEECPSEGEEGEQVFGTFEIKHPPPGPDPALEELFSDVDASYYDLDTVLTGMQAAPKMGPYDLLESLSSHGPAPLSSGSSCRADLNELDHIMEIIVGS
ncbi:unnamed protein product [Arctogadus glacialis]